MLTAQELLNKEYLETRCQLLEIAATLDRIECAAQLQDEPLTDDRLGQIYASLRLLANEDTKGETPSRAKRLLLMFSDADDG